LSMKYASASANRTMGLYVNNVRMRTLSFAATGGYTTYSTLSTEITLSLGTNQIKLQVDYQNGDSGDVNFDYFTLTPKNTTEAIDASICPVKDNKQAIWTFTTDDGLYNSVVQYNNLFKKYELKGSVGLNSNSIQDTDNGLNWISQNGFHFYCGTWDLWKALLADGKFDIVNHSASHYNLTEISSSQLDSEINGARATLLSRFNRQPVLGFISPFGQSNNSATSVIRQQHFADRSFDEGTNSLDPSNDLWYNLLTYSAVADVSVNTMNSWIDSTIADKEWCIETWHGILCDATASETLWSPPTYDICEGHLSYVANNLDKLWNATYTEAIQYIRERQNATLSVLSNNSTQIQLSLIDSLDNTLFNYPLTLKVQVPNNWASVSVMQNGNSKNIVPVTESGITYIYFDAIPDQGNIEITKSTLEKLEITNPATKLSYTVGDSLDITGMVVTGTYSDGIVKTIPITVANVTGFNSTAQADSQVLTVTYDTQSVSYTVTINKSTIISKKYEAENGVYSGGAHNQYDVNASGEYIAAYFGAGTSTTITLDGCSAGDYQLSMKYAAAINNRTMSLYVNNVYFSDLCFPATGGYTTYSDMNINLPLKAGSNEIKLQVDNVDTGDVNFDYYTLTKASDLVEATLDKIEITKQPTRLSYSIGENLDLTGLVVTGTYSDGSVHIVPITAADVTGFDSSVQVDSQILTVTYGGKAVTYTITINGTELTSGKYEAENGVYAKGAHSQYDVNASGKYIAAYFGTGTSTTITVDGGTGGNYQLLMKYAAAVNNRTMSLYVNNVLIRDLSFTSTGGYTTYSDMNTNITLNAGSNKIKLQVNSGDTGDVNFDYIILQ